MNAYRNYNNNTSQINKNIEKLSSGYTINRAGDDAAGLAISEKMRAQITGLEGAQKNAKDGISLVQTAEGALTEVHSMLNRMYSLAEQSANGTYDENTDRAQLQKEVSAMRTEINRIADSANFNGLKLLDGSMASVAIDWSATETSMEGYKDLKSFVGISFSGSSEDVDKLVDALTSGGFTAEITSTGKLAKGSVIQFASMGTMKAQTGDGLNVKVTDSSGREVAMTDDGDVTFGDSGEAYAYDGDRRLNFQITNDREETIANIAYRFDAEEPEGGLVSIFEYKRNDGENAGELELQIGDDASPWNILSLSISDIHSAEMGLDNVDISEPPKSP